LSLALPVNGGGYVWAILTIDRRGPATTLVNLRFRHDSTGAEFEHVSRSIRRPACASIWCSACSSQQPLRGNRSAPTVTVRVLDPLQQPSWTTTKLPASPFRKSRQLSGEPGDPLTGTLVNPFVGPVKTDREPWRLAIWSIDKARRRNKHFGDGRRSLNRATLIEFTIQVPPATRRTISPFNVPSRAMPRRRRDDLRPSVVVGGAGLDRFWTKPWSTNHTSKRSRDDLRQSLLRATLPFGGPMTTVHRGHWSAAL